MQIEFARKYSYEIPLVGVTLRDIDDGVLLALSRNEKEKVSDLKELSKHIGRVSSAKTLMSLSRECDKLFALGLIHSIRTGKSREISLTSLGKQYTRFLEYETPALRLKWQRRM